MGWGKTPSGMPMPTWVEAVDEEFEQLNEAVEALHDDSIARKATCEHLMYGIKGQRERVDELYGIVKRQAKALQDQQKQIDVLRDLVESMYNLFDHLSDTTFDNTHWSIDGEFFTLSEIACALFEKLGLGIKAEPPKESTFEIIDAPKEEE